MASKPIEILIEAKTTGDSEVGALSKRLDELGSQQALIDSFVKIKKETQEASDAFNAAQAKAQQLGRELANTSAPTKTQAAEFARAREAVNGTKEAYQAAQLKLQGLHGALKDNNIETTGLAQKQAALRKGVSEVEASVAGATARLREMGAVGPKAAGDTAQATDRAAKSTSGYQGALTQIASAVAGAFAVNKVVDFAKSVGEISDQYKNLQARIQLVTGEGKNFAQAWQGVTDVALRTHSSLEETGTLFARLAQAGKDAGLSAAVAGEQSLALTETINQAIQLSGAGAQASSAAITQLVQGLQGGALRGDEFNSVMEQSPRLARALADGLGVTTGELRKMAEAGALTSETVINALKGQSDAVASEFSKLPPTVGRALQDLSTQWTLYVAETDRAAGASTAAASIIDALASNLRTIAGLLLDVGQAGAALAALKLAQHFLGIGAAAQSATTAVAAANAQMAATGAAAGGAAAAASRFSVILGGLRTFTLIGLITNFQDIGKWIGESAAKLAGYKDRTEELARAEQAQAAIAKEAAADRARLAASIQAAIDKQFELSKAARAGVAEFEKLTKEGGSAAEVIKKVGAAFDLSSTQGVKDFSAVLDKLAADGKVAAGEVEKAWSQALSGRDLAQFEVMARAAFSGSAREGERLGQVMDAIVSEAVKRTGLNFDELQGKIGTASRSALNDLDAIVVGLDGLKAQGLDTGRVLSASISKAIDTADGQKALDAVIVRIEEMRRRLGDKVADGLLDQARQKAEALGEALDKAKPGINSVAEAMKALGITSDESLRRTAATSKEAYEAMVASGTASARELGDGFRRAAQDAIAANGGIAPSWVTAQASARGYKIEVDEAGKATVKSMKEAADATDRVRRAAGGAAGGYRDMAGAAQQAAESAKKLQEIYDRNKVGNGSDKVGKSGDVREAAVMQYDINQDIAKRYGDNAVGNDLAEQAWQLRQLQQSYQKNYGGARSQQSLLQQRNIGAELTRVEAELKASMGGGDVGGGAGGPASRPTPAGPSTGTPTVVNINVEGVRRSIETNAQGARDLQDLIRQLQDDKGRS